MEGRKERKEYTLEWKSSFNKPVTESERKERLSGGKDGRNEGKKQRME